MPNEPAAAIEILRAHPLVADVHPVEEAGSGRTVLQVRPSRTFQAPGFGLFYFSDQEAEGANDDYRLYLDGARIADQMGLDAVWTPERHFTGVGAASPNPSVLSAALAMTTRQIALRAGSVVLPLHHPVRVAEEWAVIDRLSGGRAGVSFASGWVQDDFILAPDRYASRRAVLEEALHQVRDLWLGKVVTYRNGAGNEAEIRIRPAPLQSEIPIWLTAAASRETFEQAGRLGVNVLSALLQLSAEQLQDNVAAYREARERAGFDPNTGNVTVMLHTFLSEDAEDARRTARPALRTYFAAQTALRHTVAGEAGKWAGEKLRISDRMLDYSVDKFLKEKCLIGSTTSVRGLVDRLTGAGVNEFACLIDFGLPAASVKSGISRIADLRHEPHLRLERDLEQALAQSGQGARIVRVMRSNERDLRSDRLAGGAA